jgi:sugar lactone lactonase YvrE
MLNLLGTFHARSIGLISALLICLTGLSQAQVTPSYTISTAVGNGVAGFLGDAGAATDANINFPLGIASDAAGNLYIADQLNNRIRKVGTDGVISTVAGNGTSGFSGDAAAATSAMLSFPVGVALDSAGNIYVADALNRRIRKISGGNINTIAGTGDAGNTGDGASATAATMSFPVGLVVDPAGNIYIADMIDNVIRKIGTDGNIATIAGNGTAGFFGDGGPALGAQLSLPEGLALDSAGNLYIADVGNHRIREMTTDGNITTIAGSGFVRGFAGDGGQAVNGVLNYPYGIALDKAGNVFIADLGNNRIRMLRTDRTIVTVAGNGTYGDQGDGGAAKSAQFRFPHAVAVDGAGRIFVSDTQNSRIRLLTPVPQTTNAAPPLISSSDIVRSGPDSWVEIYGSNLAGGSAADTKVMVSGQDAYVSYVSPNQVNAKVPSTVGAGRQGIMVITPSGASEPYPIAVDQ